MVLALHLGFVFLFFLMWSTRMKEKIEQRPKIKKLLGVYWNFYIEKNPARLNCSTFFATGIGCQHVFLVCPARIGHI